MTDRREEGVLGLTVVTRFLWRYKITYVIALSLAIFSAIIIWQSATPVYEAELILAPADPLDSNMLARNGGLAGFGISGLLGAQEDTRVQVFKELTKSQNVASAISTDSKLMNILFQENWSGEQKIVKPNSILEWLGLSPKSNLKSVMARLEDDLTYVTLDQGPLTKMKFRHPSPDNAKEIVSFVHRQAEQLIREQEREKSIARAEYLNSRLSETNQTYQREVLIELFKESEQKTMLVENELPIAVAIVDGPYASLSPIWPKPAFILALNLIVFAVLGTAYIFFRLERISVSLDDGI